MCCAPGLGIPRGWYRGEPGASKDKNRRPCCSRRTLQPGEILVKPVLIWSNPFQLDPTVQNCVDCYTSDWVVVNRKYQQYSSSVCIRYKVKIKIKLFNISFQGQRWREVGRGAEHTEATIWDWRHSGTNPWLWTGGGFFALLNSLNAHRAISNGWEAGRKKPSITTRP